jgi:UrcA family protein
MIKFALIAAATLTLAAGPALAKDGSWPVGNDQIHLVYSHIDMGAAAGRAEMAALVERAADKLCAGQPTRFDQKACARAAVVNAAASPQNKGLALALSERYGSTFAALQPAGRSN